MQLPFWILFPKIMRSKWITKQFQAMNEASLCNVQTCLRWRVSCVAVLCDVYRGRWLFFRDNAINQYHVDNPLRRFSWWLSDGPRSSLFQRVCQQWECPVDYPFGRVRVRVSGGGLNPIHASRFLSYNKQGKSRIAFARLLCLIHGTCMTML